VAEILNLAHSDKHSKLQLRWRIELHEKRMIKEPTAET
jgi:hypothetical protein